MHLILTTITFMEGLGKEENNARQLVVQESGLLSTFLAEESIQSTLYLYLEV